MVLQIKVSLAQATQNLTELETKIIALALQLPNTTHPDVPSGGEECARTIRTTWAGPSGSSGDAGALCRPPPRPLALREPKDHIELGTRLGLFDFDAGSEVSGSKFVYMTSAGALLELGLVIWAMKAMAAKGFEPVITPDVVRQGVIEACGFNPRGQHTQFYAIDGTDLVLTGTAEAPLAGMWMNRQLRDDELPARQVGFSHCFRTEVGSRGAEVRGLYRLHQFSKVELFSVTRPEQSAAMLEELRSASEDLLDQLGLQYRVLEMPSAELGSPAHRKYDIETWMPGKGEFGEVASISTCTDYQSRRLNIRVAKTKTSASTFAHTLNGTAIAIPRVIISILETHQQDDGSVVVPEVLRPYVGTDVLQPKL
eukprot:SAG22_NODE_1166_length_5291_cov_4.322227_3_plen_369_part_00